MLIQFAGKHLVRHGRMNLVVWLVFLLTAVFLSGLPAYAAAIAGRGLVVQIANAPVNGRNIRIINPVLDEALYAQLEQRLPGFLGRRLTVWEGAPVDGVSTLYRGEEELPFSEFLALQPWAFDQVTERVTVTAGRMPVGEVQVDADGRLLVEALIGQDAYDDAFVDTSAGNTFSRIQMQLGDELITDDDQLRIRVVGVAAPIQPDDELWYGSRLPFSFTRQSLHGLNMPETITYSLIVPEAVATEVWPDMAHYWRILSNMEAIKPDNVAALRNGLADVQTQLGVQVETSLYDLLGQFSGTLAVAQVTLLLLMVQSLIFVLYTLAMVASFVVEQSQREVVTLVGRGFNGRQMTMIFSMQALLLGLLALPLGPLGARALLQLWGLATDTAVPQQIPVQAWQLSAVAILFGWFIYTLGIYFATRGSILRWQAQIARPPQKAVWQRYYLDVFLLVLGGLVYWQLLEAGTMVTAVQQNAALAAAGIADPLLLLGPTLLLVAMALFFLRLFPYLLRLVAWLTRGVRGLVLPFSIVKLARDPLAPSRVVLLITLAAGLLLFTSLFSYSLATRQAQIAHYQAGADLRVGLPITAVAEDVAEIAAIPGVQAASALYRNARSRLASNLGQQATLLAVDAATLAEVARYAPFVSSLTVADVLAVVAGGSESGAIPAVFSAAAPPRNKQVGDVITYIVGQDKVDFEVRGIIRAFPFVEDEAFYLAALDAVETAVPLERQTTPWEGQREVWLAVDGAQHEAVVAALQAGVGPVGTAVLDDAQARQAAMQADLIAAETIGAFQLNGWTLGLLSVIIFLLVNFFAMRKRMYEFGVLRASGLARRQLLGLLSLEGVLLLLLGLSAGTLTGWGLAVLMRPFLSRVLATAVGGDAIQQILVNWGELLRVYGVLIGAYVLALTLLLLALGGAGIYRAVRIGDE